MATSLRQVVLYVLIVHWTVVVAVVEEQKTHGDVEKHGNNNNVVQQTQDLTSLSKLIARSGSSLKTGPAGARKNCHRYHCS